VAWIVKVQVPKYGKSIFLVVWMWWCQGVGSRVLMLRVCNQCYVRAEWETCEYSNQLGCSSLLGEIFASWGTECSGNSHETVSKFPKSMKSWDMLILIVLRTGLELVALWFNLFNHNSAQPDLVWFCRSEPGRFLVQISLGKWLTLKPITIEHIEKSLRLHQATKHKLKKLKC